jgi:hypothetical protein
MTNHRLKHDISWRWAADGVEPVAHLLNPSEQRELHAVLYEHAQKALADFLCRAERQRERLEPSAN